MNTTVSLTRKDTGRYGRTIGVIQVEGRILNAELIRMGFAWHFKKYSSSPFLSELEIEARQKKLGLWIEGAPVPPWSYRKVTRNRHKLERFDSGKQEIVVSGIQGGRLHGVIFHGNVKSHKFHKPNCPHYRCKNCVKSFSSMEEAIHAGYEPCNICMPP